MFSPETYALLNSKIKAVTSGIKNVTIGSDNKSLVFTTNSGANITIALPNPINDTILINKITVDANNKLCYDGQPIDTDTIVNGLTFNQTTKELKITLNDGQEFKTTIPTEVLTQSQKEALKHISGNTTTVGNETTTTLDFGALQIVEVNNSATGDITYEATFNGESVVTKNDVATTTDDGLSDFFNSIII